MPTRAILIKEIRDVYESTIVEYKDKLKYLRDESVKNSMTLISNVLKKAYQIKKRKDTVYSFQLFGKRLYANINISIESLKADDVGTFIMWLEENIGECRRSSDWVNSYTASRDFDFVKDDLTCSITFDLPVDGVSCGRVQTGFEVIERPVYKLQCN